MTLYQKLQEEYPERIGEQWCGGCLGCPADYDYSPAALGNLDCLAYSGFIDYTSLHVICEKCWHKEISVNNTFNSLLSVNG